ncbi:uncharacterized protein LOC120901998 [Anopheles arabiensis]|uniref:uncharacterized protein LOC120901998 n=1 Tax=Anopheles arabiensis TaxID=7173 RepID=UPI001AACC980|nr:uncharacterized protein LOC120901998 [Anopheles arabiensis]
MKTSRKVTLLPRQGTTGSSEQFDSDRRLPKKSDPRTHHIEERLVGAFNFIFNLRSHVSGGVFVSCEAFASSSMSPSAGPLCISEHLRWKNNDALSTHRSSIFTSLFGM